MLIGAIVGGTDVLRVANYLQTGSRPIAQLETQAWHCQCGQDHMARQVIGRH